MNGEDVVTLDGGSAAGVIPPETQPGAAPVPPTRWFPLLWEQNQFLKEAH